MSNTRLWPFNPKIAESGNDAPRAATTLLGLAIAEGRLSTLCAIAAIAVISSIAAVPVMFPGFGRRAIAVPVPPLL